MDALELEVAKQSSGIQTAKDLFSGAVGGVAQVLIGESLINAAANMLRTAHHMGQKLARARDAI
jgi:hypothetical protein